MAYFKYKNITDILRQRILTGVYPTEEKMPTEMALCEEFSVSRRTIRTALACLDAERLVSIQQGSGVYVEKWQQSLDSEPLRNSKNVTVILTDVESYIYPVVLKGINNELIKQNYELTLYITENSFFKEAQVIESVLSSNTDAVILDPVTKVVLANVNKHLYQKIAQKFPCLTIYTKIPDSHIPTITVADIACFCEITRYVIARGHRKLAGVFCYDESSGVDRFKGFVQTVRAAKLTLKEQRILWISRSQLFDPELEEVLDKFVAVNDDCSAFLCVNDHVASRLILSLNKHGRRVPEDVSITGFDNSLLLSTNITTIAHPQEKMGERVAKSILELIDNPSSSVDYLYPPVLIDKGSVSQYAESGHDKKLDDLIE